MYATEDYARRLATARLIERVGDELQEASYLTGTAEDFLHLLAIGPGGMAILEGREVATLLFIIRGLSGHARDALEGLNAAAEMLREDE